MDASSRNDFAVNTVQHIKPCEPIKVESSGSKSTGVLPNFLLASPCFGSFNGGRIIADPLHLENMQKTISNEPSTFTGFDLCICLLKPLKARSVLEKNRNRWSRQTNMKPIRETLVLQPLKQDWRKA